MHYKRLKIYGDKLNLYKKQFNEIISGNNNDKLEDLKKIIDNCNVFEQFNLEYLKLLKNFESKESFEKDLKKYEVTISDENLNKYFKEFYNNNINSCNNTNNTNNNINTNNNSNTNNINNNINTNNTNIINNCIYNNTNNDSITSIHTSKKIQLIIAQLITLQFQSSLNKEEQKDDLEQKLDEQKNKETLEQLLLQLNYESKNAFKTNFQLLPFDNIKLFLNKVYDIFCKNIYEQIKSFSNFNNYKTNEEKEFDVALSNEIELMINKLEAQNFTSNNQLSEELELKEIKLISFRILHNNKFKEYINGLKNFYFETSDYFNKRIKSDDFKDEEYIYMYEKYFFFISNYNFFYLDTLYIDIWKESIKSYDIKYIKVKIEAKNKDNDIKEQKKIFKLINQEKDIEMTFGEKKFIIKNFDRFSFKVLIKLLCNKSDFLPIDDFQLLKALKIQYFDNYIKETILNEKWRNFFYRICTSNVVDNLVQEVYKHQIEKENYKQLIDSISFFNFNSHFYGQTFSYANIFISGLMNINVYNNNDKIRYYIMILISILHEVLGHSLVFILQNIFDKNILSPLTTGSLFSNYANKRQRESGEYMIICLFGKKISYLSFDEIFYIFDLKNYEMNKYTDFKNKFLELQNKITLGKQKIPDVFEDILKEESIKYNGLIPVCTFIKDDDEIPGLILFDEGRICNINDLTNYNNNNNYIKNNQIN